MDAFLHSTQVQVQPHVSIDPCEEAALSPFTQGVRQRLSLPLTEEMTCKQCDVMYCTESDTTPCNKYTIGYNVVSVKKLFTEILQVIAFWQQMWGSVAAIMWG
jgi:hypothetical protein